MEENKIPSLRDIIEEYEDKHGPLSDVEDSASGLKDFSEYIKSKNGLNVSPDDLIYAMSRIERMRKPKDQSYLAFLITAKYVVSVDDIKGAENDIINAFSCIIEENGFGLDNADRIMPKLQAEEIDKMIKRADIFKDTVNTTHCENLRHYFMNQLGGIRGYLELEKMEVEDK